MTEEEWLATTDPERILDFQDGKSSNRKLRLFSVACIRRISPKLNERWRVIVDTFEKCADGEDEQNQLLALINSIPRPERSVSASVRVCCARGCDPTVQGRKNALAASVYSADALAEDDPEHGEVHLRWTPTWREERSFQTTLARDIFGNPFRPVAFSPDWRTPTAVSLAQSIYDDRELPSGLFDNGRLAVLADALEDAGCDNADVLGHLRGGGEHVRGCWAVDLLLGKE